MAGSARANRWASAAAAIIILLLPAALQAAEPPDMALLTLINQTRQAAGLERLQPAPSLQEAAAAHGGDLARCGMFSHTGCDGSDLELRLRRSRYPFALAAENLALGTEDAAATLRAWLDSPGHRENLLRPDLREAGIFHGSLRGQALWVLVVAAR